MPISLHSHSGQFCLHGGPPAGWPLESSVRLAMEKGFRTWGMTEHVPRHEKGEMYPEEEHVSPAVLSDMFSSYILEAARLKKLYLNANPTPYSSRPSTPTAMERNLDFTSSSTEARGAINPFTLLIGLETENVSRSSPSFETSSIGRLLSLIAQPRYSSTIDYIVGSVHHVCGVPIDYDRQMFTKALEAAAGRSTDGLTPVERLFSEYFDAQMEVLENLKPEIIGHFDLIRLFLQPSDLGQATASENEAGIDILIKETFPQSVWPKVIRNIKYAIGYGALFEINTAGWRKKEKQGWASETLSPWPNKEIIELILFHGGKLTLSDDSHSAAQIGKDYPRTRDWLRGSGGFQPVDELWTLTLGPEHEELVASVEESTGKISRQPFTRVQAEPVKEWWKDSFWEGLTL